MIDASTPVTASYSSAYMGKAPNRPPLKHHNSSINMRSKGILRYKKPFRKLKSTAATQMDSEKQRSGLNSILRPEDGTDMTAERG